MDINPQFCSSEERWMLNELQPVLQYTLRDAGTVLLPKQQPGTTGFRLHQTQQQAELCYAKKPDFCRALLALCTKPQTTDLQETCRFADFGISLDCSRNAVPRTEQIKRFLRFSALMGYNFLALYLEDTLKVEGEPYFGYQRGAFSPQTLRELDTYAQGFGIELRAYLETLAHLNQITRYAAYEPIVDTGDILLAGEDRTYALLDHLLKTVSECLTSRKVNIGMDEAFLAGQGRYREKHGSHPRTEVLLQHLNRVLEICDRYGLQAQMWSDLFCSRDDSTPDKSLQLPPNVQLAYWDYYSCDRKHYDQLLKKHRTLTEAPAFAGGAWKWTGFTPHNHYSIETGKAALTACADNHVSSVVITTWGDDGAEASIFSVLPAFYADAQLAWNTPLCPERFYTLTGLSFEDFLKIDLPCRFSDRPGIHNNASKFLLYQDVLFGTFDSVVPANISSFYSKAADALADCCKQERFAELFETQRQLCQVLALKADLGLQVRAAYTSHNRTRMRCLTDEVFPELLLRLSDFTAAFLRQWDTENRSFGREVQELRLAALANRLRHTQSILRRWLDGRLPTVEELDEPQQPFGYFEQPDIEQLNYNLWGNIVTPGVLG